MRSTLFTVFGLPVRAYGFTLVIGFLAGLYRAVKVAKARRLDTNAIYDIAVVVLVSGIIGSRALFVLLNHNDINPKEIFNVWDGGLSFLGGLVLALIAGYIYVRIKKLDFLVYADVFMPSVAIAYAITRIGCFLNGCCYGCPTQMPWGVSFDGGIPSHPTQLYATVISLVIFFILTRLEKTDHKPGFILASYMFLYGVYRFFIEFLRANYTADMWYFGLTQAQGFSLLMIIISAIFCTRLYGKNINKR